MYESKVTLKKESVVGSIKFFFNYFTRIFFYHYLPFQQLYAYPLLSPKLMQSVAMVTSYVAISTMWSSQLWMKLVVFYFFRRAKLKNVDKKRNLLTYVFFLHV